LNSNSRISCTSASPVRRRENMTGIINFLNIRFSGIRHIMQFGRKDRVSKTKEQYFISRRVPGWNHCQCLFIKRPETIKPAMGFGYDPRSYIERTRGRRVHGRNDLNLIQFFSITINVSCRSNDN